MESELRGGGEEEQLVGHRGDGAATPSSLDWGRPDGAHKVEFEVTLMILTFPFQRNREQPFCRVPGVWKIARHKSEPLSCCLHQDFPTLPEQLPGGGAVGGGGQQRHLQEASFQGRQLTQVPKDSEAFQVQRVRQLRLFPGQIHDWIEEIIGSEGAYDWKINGTRR